MKYNIPEINMFPFRIVVFRTERHGRVIFSCRWNAALYATPAEQIREQEAETFANPDFKVLGEIEIRKEACCV